MHEVFVPLSFSLPPSVPPSLPSSLPPFLPLPLSPSLPPSLLLPPSLSPPPSLPLSLSLSLPLPPSLPPPALPSPSLLPPSPLPQVADFFSSNGQHEKAVHLLVRSKKTEEALDMCMAQNITITEEMAEHMTLPKTPNGSAASDTISTSLQRAYMYLKVTIFAGTNV